jgi:hypothetical protein
LTLPAEGEVLSGLGKTAGTSAAMPETQTNQTQSISAHVNPFS